MRLKLMAPFEVEGFSLHAARIMEDPDAYEAAWEETTRNAGGDPRSILPDLTGSLGPDAVELLHFTHRPGPKGQWRSRYRTIDTHALRRPLHAIEGVVRPSASWWMDRLSTVGKWSPFTGGVAGALEAAGRPPGALVRVHDHRIGLIEFDLPVPLVMFGNGKGPDVAGPLDGLQHLGIGLAEELVDEVSEQVLLPLMAWLRAATPIGDRYLRASDDARRAGSRSGARNRTLWVTRSLVLDDAAAPFRSALAGHWLKDVAERDGDVTRCTEHPDASCTSWLNYFFGECSYPRPYPDDGWVSGEPADGSAKTGFSPTWEALIIAQYYYAAFDRLQSRISRILAVSVAGEQRRSASVVKNELDGAIRDAQMLKVDQEENRKYYARRVAAKMDEILDGWGFEGLCQQVQQRIDDCSTRLNDLHTRSIERSSMYTDILLIAIGITAIFQVLLFLASYGRTMSADPFLQGYDRESWLNVAAWIGGSSTDILLFAGSLFSVGLIALYAFVRSVRSRV